MDDLPKKKSNNQSPSKHQTEKTQFDQIDEKWVANIDPAIIQLLICPICLDVIIQPVQCEKCGRMICRKDYYNTKSSKINNSCPICRTSPFTKKQAIHIANKGLFESLRFDCRLCQAQEKYTFSSLIKHLDSIHNQKLLKNSQKIKIESYSLEVDPKCGYPLKNIKLNKLQNIQIYSALKQNEKYSEQLEILDQQFITITLNLKKGFFDSHIGVYGRVLIEFCQEIENGKEFQIWCFKNNQRYQFFLAEHQDHLNASFEHFLANPAHNITQITSQNKKMHYQINFQTMQQKNLKTNYPRKIQKRLVKINEK